MWDWAKLPSHSTNTGNCGRRYGVSVNLHMSRGRKCWWSGALATHCGESVTRIRPDGRVTLRAASSGNQSGPCLFPNAPAISISKHLVACQGRFLYVIASFGVPSSRNYEFQLAPSVYWDYFQDKLHARRGTGGVQMQCSNHRNFSTNFHAIRNFWPLSDDWCSKSVKFKLVGIMNSKRDGGLILKSSLPRVIEFSNQW